MTGGASQPRKPRPIATPRGVILLLLLTAMLFTSVYPMRRYFDVRARIDALRQEERMLDQRAAELTGQKDLLVTDDEVERIAREDLGYVRPGEVPFVVASPPDPADEPSRLDTRPVEQTREAAGLLQRWASAVAHAAAAIP